MLKIFILTFLFVIGASILLAMYGALVIARRSDKQANMENNEGDDDMFWKKQLCPNCRTGKESYELDQHSESCPYIGYLKEGKCSFFVPFEGPQNRNIQEKQDQ